MPSERANPIYRCPQPQLWGHGLYLSVFTFADLPRVLQGDRDSETARRFGWAREDTSAEKVGAFIATCAQRWSEGERASWAVRGAGDSLAALGHVELRLRDEGRARISYSTFPWARGRGLAARAADIVCVFAFERLRVARLQLLTDADNVASRRVAAKAGFTVEGVLREYGERDGKRHDMVLYARLRSDPRPSFEPLNS